MSKPTDEDIQKTIDAKKAAGTDELWREHESCATFERELGKTRWTFFVTMLSVSLLVGGLCFQFHEDLPWFLEIGALVLAWWIFVTAYYHYNWFHRKSEALRGYLVRLEEALEIFPYRIRTRRPHLGRVRLYFHWAIDGLFVIYTLMLVLAILRSTGVLV